MKDHENVYQLKVKPKWQFGFGKQLKYDAQSFQTLIKNHRNVDLLKVKPKW